MQTTRIIVTAFLFAALLSGCRTGSTPSAAVDPLPEPATTTPAEVATVAPSPQPTAVGARGATVATEPVVMVATDPATVKLAAGQLQFVEFFAFW